ncbi:Translation initiation factor 2 [hydrothermal vent metagenome]|uniref:Translation initiation factor 2 n=1 Tax=hydrothermal vent metagenome TaxID=652676 RepID=A0A1W1DIT4_9ZZZZ
MMVPVSAHTGEGVDALLESITLTAEILEFSAVVDAPASGTVLEARLDKGRGKVTTILVQSGTLKKGDIMIAGLEYGKVKQIVDDNGKPVKQAGPSTPVEVLGLSGVPNSGDEVLVVESERKDQRS